MNRVVHVLLSVFGVEPGTPPPPPPPPMDAGPPPSEIPTEEELRWARRQAETVVRRARALSIDVELERSTR